jgi:5-dehydro-2-deoxygluconokinase
MDLSKLGYNKPLYILPFDHRSAFATELFKKKSIDDLSNEEKELIREFKMLIYKGIKKAVESLIPKENAAILVDEEFGQEVLLDAKHNGFTTILTIEKSGHEEFDFMYKDFKEHIEKFKPDFVKVLIKYNPKDSTDLKKRQQDKLKILSDYAHENNYKFLLEVLVLPTKEQLFEVNGSREAYDRKLRPELTAEVIRTLQTKGIEPDVWKLEGMETASDYSDVIKEVRSGGRKNVSVVILGRGANEEKVHEWLRIGAKANGVIGFAVGRTIFWDVIEKFYKGQIGKASVIEVIGKKFESFYKVFSYFLTKSTS